MYSFPYPASSDISPIKVPYVAMWKYSLSGPYKFEDFLDRIDRLTPILSSAGFLNIEASMVQSWLFFGLASEALGRDVHEEFIEVSDEVDHSEGLIDVRISKWFWTELTERLDHLQTNLPEEEWKSKRQRLNNCLVFAFAFLSLRDRFAQDTESDELLDKVFLSVRMLQCAIADAIGLPFDCDIIAVDLTRRSTQLLLGRMVQNGWCKKRLNFVTAVTVPYPSLYYLASSSPAHGENTDHSQCTLGTCSVSAVLATPLHRTSGCECMDIRVPIDKVLRILEDGGVPLVRVTCTHNIVELDVVRYTSGTRYTAISHVWSDRQYGSSKNALPRCQLMHLHSLMAKLPVPLKHRGIFSMFTGWRPYPGGVEDVPQTEWLFWLDTFCIPQHPAHAHVRNKAIDMMNLVYAAATQTLVLDAKMQGFDVGQEPTSDCSTGPPLFFGPTKESLTDSLASICGSNWMGRAWTLQEGVVSTRCAFQFNNSIAFVGILHLVVEQLRHDIIRDSSLFQVMTNVLSGKDFWASSRVHAKVENEPFIGAVAGDLLRIVKAMLDIQSLNDYPRRPNERVKKFIHAHRHLQSRSTTQPEDLPLILVNLSGLNANHLSRICETNERMRLLVYGLGVVPVELLFSDCSRIEGDTAQVDSWIPCEVAAENFSGERLLRLEPEGFSFHHGDDSALYGFYMFSGPSPQNARFGLSCLRTANEKKLDFRAEDLSARAHDSAHIHNTNGCILIDQSLGPDHIRGAQFFVTRVENDKIFLKYIRPLRLWYADDRPRSPTKEEIPGGRFYIRLANPRKRFILERSSSTIAFDPRPLNPKQYHNRIDFFMGNIFPWVDKLITPFIWALCRKVFRNDILAFLAAVLAGLLRIFLLERFLHSISHRGWVATYSRSWTPRGPWKWFWRYMNFASPIPFRSYAKALAACSFVLCVLTSQYCAVLAVSLYWLPLFDRKQLGTLYVWALVYKLSFYVF